MHELNGNASCILQGIEHHLENRDVLCARCLAEELDAAGWQLPPTGELVQQAMRAYDEEYQASVRRAPSNRKGQGITREDAHGARVDAMAAALAGLVSKQRVFDLQEEYQRARVVWDHTRIRLESQLKEARRAVQPHGAVVNVAAALTHAAYREDVPSDMSDWLLAQAEKLKEVQRHAKQQSVP